MLTIPSYTHGYLFRVVVPEFLRSAIGKREIKKSLMTIAKLPSRMLARKPTLGELPGIQRPLTGDMGEPALPAISNR